MPVAVACIAPGRLCAMASISLLNRRRTARGLNARQRAAWRGRKFLGIGNRAVLSLGTGHAAVAYFADTPGTAGNSITVRYVVSGASTPLSVSVSTLAITVNVATDGASAATSTAAEVVHAINNSADASPLVWAYLPDTSNGSGVVAAVGATALAGGV